MNKFLITILTIILLSGCSKKVDEVSSATWNNDESDTVIAVESLKATKGEIYPSVEAAGVIAGIREAYIVSETRGIIEEVGFEIGDKITTENILLRVDDTIARLSMEQAKQQYDSAELDLISTESFYKKGSASLSELTRARSSANGAKAFYESSLKSFEDSYIQSPIVGEIAWKEDGITKGNFLNQGIRVARVVDLSSIRVEISVGERQIGLIELGAEVKISITSLYNSDFIIGKVVAIASGSDLSTGSFSVIIEAKNIYPETLKAGMSSSVSINTKSITPEFIVPTDSVVEREGKEYLFIDRNGIAEPAEIIKGEVIGNRTVIISGINQNELLIISGLNSIKPGVKVKSRVVGSSGEWL